MNTFVLNMIHCQAMSALKQQKAIARETALVQQQAFQAASQAMLSYRPPPPAYGYPRGLARHTTAHLGEIIPGRFRANGQPMTKSGQVCKKYLTGSCTYGAKCIFEHPTHMAPAPGTGPKMDMVVEPKQVRQHLGY